MKLHKRNKDLARKRNEMGDTIGYASQRELLATQLQAQMTNGRKSFWLSRKPCLKKRLLTTALPPRTDSRHLFRGELLMKQRSS